MRVRAHAYLLRGDPSVAEIVQLELQSLQTSRSGLQMLGQDLFELPGDGCHGDGVPHLDQHGLRGQRVHVAHESERWEKGECVCVCSKHHDPWVLSTAAWIKVTCNKETMNNEHESLFSWQKYRIEVPVYEGEPDRQTTRMTDHQMNRPTDRTTNRHTVWLSGSLDRQTFPIDWQTDRRANRSTDKIVWWAARRTDWQTDGLTGGSTYWQTPNRLTTDRQTYICHQTCRLKDKKTNQTTERQTDSLIEQTDGQSDRKTDRWIYTSTDRETYQLTTDRQTDWQPCYQPINRQTDRQVHLYLFFPFALKTFIETGLQSTAQNLPLGFCYKTLYNFLIDSKPCSRVWGQRTSLFRFTRSGQWVRPHWPCNITIEVLCAVSAPQQWASMCWK